MLKPTWMFMDSMIAQINVLSIPKLFFFLQNKTAETLE